MARREEPTTHGWFIDPQNSEQLRFWSGTTWTSLTKFPTAEEAEVARSTGDPSSGAAVPAPRPRASDEDTERRPSPRPSPRPTIGPRVTAAPGLLGMGGSVRTRDDEDDLEDDHLAARLLAENPYAAATMAATGLYLILAITTGLVLVGILPVVLAIEAVRRREKAAFLAGLAAAVAVMIWISIRA